MTTMTATSVAASRSPFDALKETVGVAYRYLCSCYRAQVAYLELNEMTDRQLRDLGINRGDIYAAVRGFRGLG